MSAPSDTTWGGVVSSNGNEGRIGISRTWVDYGTFERATIRVWFWSKYTVSDTNNSCNLSVTGAFNGNANGTYALKSGVVSNIQSPTNTNWSTQNQTLLVEHTIDLTKGKQANPIVFNASLQKIDILGNKEMTASRTYTIDALTSSTVSYNANGGTNAPSSQTKWYGSVLKLSTQTPTRSGYSFLGWGTSSTDTTVDYSAGANYGTDKSITLYAIWKPNEYQVLYDANGGVNAPSGQTKLHDTPLPLQTAIPTRTYYNFLGWSTNKTATEPTYNSGDTYTTNASVTLYAVWELAYVKPRINNLKVYRCDSEGNMADDGEYAKITFDWATDKDGARYCAYYKKDNEDEYISCVGVDMSTTSGSVETFLIGASGNVKFDPDYAYSIKLNVADSFGYNHEERILHATFFTFDVTEDGRNMSFGESAHDEEDEVLRFAFKTIDLSPKHRLLYKGENLLGQKVLWSGMAIMDETHFIDLPKKISECKNGILLVFSRNGDYNLISYFIPKESVLSFGRTGWAFPLVTALFDYIGCKTLYIGDSRIDGHAENDATGKNATSGITYHNEAFMLRYVYEV